MNVTLVLLIVLFAVLAIIGVPLALALGLSTFVSLALTTDMLLVVIAQKVQLGADSYLMMAVPLFILAANIMNYSGVTERIFRFARALVGSMPGALGHANVVASVVFAGISGSAIADSASLGNIEIKSMEDQGYPTEYAAAITVASATIGPIFPPSIPLVIYAGIASVSVGKLFMGGVVPGLIIALALMALNHILSVKNKYPRDERMTLRQVWDCFRESFLPILSPAIILFGITFGWFTPTEAAAVIVLYAFILGFFVYKELKLSFLPRIFKETMMTTGIVMFIVAAANAFSYVLTICKLGNVLTDMAAAMPNAITFIIVVNILLLILGMFMESTAILIVITPVLVPVAQAMGIDLVYFGVMMVLNLMIGLATPPFGMGLFTVSQVAKLPVEKTVKAILPFIPVLLVVLLMIIFIPSLITWLPSVIM